MNGRQYTEEELLKWSESLPRLEARAVSEDVLKRISAGVVDRIDSRSRRTSRSYRLFQPLFSSVFTVTAVIALFTMFHPTGPSSNVRKQAPELLSMLSQTVPDSQLLDLSSSDLDDLLVTEYSSSKSSEQVVEKAFTVWNVDNEELVAQLSESEKAEILNALNADTQLEWSELL